MTASIDTEYLSVEKIQTILGVQSLTAVKRMVEVDPVRMGAIIAKVI